MTRKIINIALASIFSVTMFACSVNKQRSFVKTSTGSTYDYKIIKTLEDADPVICASAYEYGTKYPLTVFRVNLDGDKTKHSEPMV